MAFLDLPLQCSITLKSSLFHIEDIIKAARYDDGFTETAVDGPHPYRRKWAIQYIPLSLTDRDTVMTFLQTHGAFRTFLFTPINGSPVTVKRDADSLKEVLSKGKFRISFSLTEQFVY